MEKEQKGQESDQQQSAGENPTLHQPGTSVADYGNVMGGSSDANVQQGQESQSRESNQGREGNNDTIGTP